MLSGEQLKKFKDHIGRLGEIILPYLVSSRSSGPLTEAYEYVREGVSAILDDRSWFWKKVPLLHYEGLLRDTMIQLGLGEQYAEFEG